MDELLGDLPEVSRLLFIYLFIHSFILLHMKRQEQIQTNTQNLTHCVPCRNLLVETQHSGLQSTGR